MTQSDLKAWLLLVGFKHKSDRVYSFKSKSLVVTFGFNDITIQKQGSFPDHKWTTFRTSTRAAFDFIKEQLT